MKQKIIVGVDVGGTKIMTGLTTPEGEVVGQPYKIATGGSDDKHAILDRIFCSIDSVITSNNIKKEDIKGIGIGCTGPLDSKNGIILECPQLPALHFYPLGRAIEDKYGLPVVMNNDANCLILGESIWGAGKGENIVLGFTLGTGLGCALVINGKLQMGSTETAGEIWTSPYKDGIIEDYISGSGISNIYKKLTGINKSAVEISGLAKKGDINAAETWNIFGEALGFAISWCTNLIDPDIIILGGSISNSFALYQKPMEDKFRKFICPVPAAKTTIIKAGLGDYAGFIGAAALIV